MLFPFPLYIVASRKRRRAEPAAKQPERRDLLSEAADPRNPKSVISPRRPQSQNTIFVLGTASGQPQTRFLSLGRAQTTIFALGTASNAIFELGPGSNDDFRARDTVTQPAADDDDDDDDDDPDPASLSSRSPPPVPPPGLPSSPYVGKGGGKGGDIVWLTSPLVSPPP